MNALQGNLYGKFHSNVAKESFMMETFFNLVFVCNVDEEYTEIVFIILFNQIS